MDEQTQKELASQLRQPTGTKGLDVAAHMNKGNAEMNRFGIQHLNLKANDNILEIGMGNGFFVKEMLDVDDSIKYSGCDFSQTMVEEAGKKNITLIEEKRAQFFHTPANKLPFGDDQFTKVLTVNTIYFWDNPVDELKEIRRVVQNSGKMILVMRSDKSLQAIPFTQFGFNIYSKDQVKQFFEESGWKVNNIYEHLEENRRYDGETMMLNSWAIEALLV